MEDLASGGAERQQSWLWGGGGHWRAPPLPPPHPHMLPSHSQPQTGSSSCCKASCPSLRQVLAEFSLPPSGGLLHPLSTWQAGAESAVRLPLLAAPRYLAQWLSPDGTGQLMGGFPEHQSPCPGWHTPGDVPGKGCSREQGELLTWRANPGSRAGAP